MTSRVKDTKKLQFLKNFEETGNISNACDFIEISRTTFYRWKEDDLDFAESFNDICESVGDFVEDQLLMQIKAGETAATIFYCKTKLRKRGYIEKVEQEVISTNTNYNKEIEPDYSGWTEEALIEYRDLKIKERELLDRHLPKGE